MADYKNCLVKAVKGSIKCSLGEGPHWDPVKEEILYVDIPGKAVVRYVPATQECYRVIIDGGKVSFVCSVEGQPNKYLIAVEREVQVMEWDGRSSKPGSLTTLYTVDQHCKTNRINDCKCDSSGRLWAGTQGLGTITGTLDRNKGTLYSFDLDGKVKKHFDKIDIANGLCWSPDNLTMYYIDSLTYRVDAFDFDAKVGNITNRRPAFDLKANGVDGMTIDSDGNLWIAIFDGKKIIHVDPREGRKLGQIDIPTKTVTSVTFGGPDLDILYLTSADIFLSNEEEAAQPDAGCLFEITNLGVKGLAPGFNHIW